MLEGLKETPQMMAGSAASMVLVCARSPTNIALTSDRILPLLRHLMATSNRTV